MIKHRGLGVAVVLLSSFAAWIYCIATVVLGLIYQAYPGQENVAILISTLPTIVMMLAAFASSVILRVCNRKLVVVVSMAISIAAGALILLVEMPLIGVILGCVGFSLARMGQGSSRASLARAGKICSIVGICLSAGIWLLNILLNILVLSL